MAAQGVVVITGGAGGMGLACAERMAGPGRTLVLADVSSERLDEAARALADRGSPVECVAGDLTAPEIVDRLARVAADAGRLEALVHTAGLSPTMASGERIVEVNLVATERLLDAFLPLAGEGTAVVLIASQSAHLAKGAATDEINAILDAPLAGDAAKRLVEAGVDLNPGAAYSFSKLGVVRAAVRLAPAWGERGARIVSLCPGIIDTGMGRQEEASQPFMATIIERTPLRRKGSADEIAKAVAFLCSDAASFVSGTDLLVDGGSTGAVLAV